MFYLGYYATCYSTKTFASLLTKRTVILELISNTRKADGTKLMLTPKGTPVNERKEPKIISESKHMFCFVIAGNPPFSVALL